MTTLESFLSADTAPARRVAELIESGTNGDLVLTVGNAVTGADDLHEMLPGGDARLLGLRFGAGRGGILAVALSPQIAEDLRVASGASLMVAVRGVLEGAIGALEEAVGASLGAEADAVEITVAELTGGADPVVSVPILEGDERIATVIMREGELEIAGADAGDDAASTHDFTPLVDGGATSAANRALELLNDVEMEVTAELGRRRMTVRDLLSLTPGAVVELDRAAGSPVDVLVNGTIIARGEVVVIDEEFGIRISEVIGRADLEAS